MRLVGYSYPVFPACMIESAGFEPVRIRWTTGGRDSVALEGLCEYASGFVAEVLQRDYAGVICGAPCDQMRRCADLLRLRSTIPVHVFHLPRTTGPAAEDLYMLEIERCNEFLRCLPGGGTDRMKNAEAFHKTVADAKSGVQFRLALIGGSSPNGSDSLMEFVSKSGGELLDWTDAIWSSDACNDADPDPIQYFNRIVSPCKRPNNAFHEWIADRVVRTGVNGIILRVHAWCDTWAAEASRLKQSAGVPLIVVKVQNRSVFDAHTASRLAAFMESLP